MNTPPRPPGAAKCIISYRLSAVISTFFNGSESTDRTPSSTPDTDITTTTSTTSTTMPTTATAIKSFLSTPSFAVLGAVPDPSRFGHKVFAWYHSHSLPVTGIHPRTPTITIGTTHHPTIASLDSLPTDPAQTALSFITPPAATLATLHTARALRVPAVWFQPGAYDEECVRFAEEAGMVVVAGPVEGEGPGGEGACVLVHGEGGLRDAGRVVGKL